MTMNKPQGLLKHRHCADCGNAMMKKNETVVRVEVTPNVFRRLPVCSACLQNHVRRSINLSKEDKH